MYMFIVFNKTHHNYNQIAGEKQPLMMMDKAQETKLQRYKSWRFGVFC